MQNTHSREFKVGDTVRATRDSWGGGYVLGHVYTVSRVSESGRHISTEVDSVGSTTNGWTADAFELVEDTCASAPLETEVSYRATDKFQVEQVVKRYRLVRTEVGEDAFFFARCRSKEAADSVASALNAAEAR